MTLSSFARRPSQALRPFLLAGAACAAAGPAAAQSHADHHRPRLNLVQAQTGAQSPPAAGHGAQHIGPAATAPAPAGAAAPPRR